MERGMDMDEWILTRNRYDASTHLHDAPVNTVGNGLFCCRGFFEEQAEGIAALGGIYMARVFGHAAYTAWKGEGRELVNVPNFFWVRIAINGVGLVITEEQLQHFSTALDLQSATLTRSYTYCKDGQPLAKLVFTRFASKADCFTAGQRIAITPLQDNLTITVDCGIDTEITNLNDVSCEPLPVQPGKKQCIACRRDADFAVVEILQPDHTRLAFAQKTCGHNATQEKTALTHRYTICVAQGVEATVEKLVAVALSPEDGDDVEAAVQRRLAALPSYETALGLHRAAMAAFWETADIVIAGNVEDQMTVRYNMLQLMQSCPEHTNRYSIAARGLTGEMYEGSVFWDTEIFMLPFFTLTRPAAARKLLEFRYNTLPEARAHAQSNWFAGAMYGWQVNAMGVEQTPKGVGAYYSIHVVADIAYAILDYWQCTGDEAFLLEGGLEILMETARFWVSRVGRRTDGSYDINAVRGPNEYDVVVNNNLYTNLMARENFRLCTQLLERFAKSHPSRLAALKESLAFDEAEADTWREIGDKLVLPYDDTQNLWLEDDTYLRRKPLDMAKAKPTAKRIIDTTIPYEALPFYQVSKQADVLHVMKNLPWYFTAEQIQIAYDFYQPKTAFDSSLSYSMFALMAARLGRMEEAERYFDLTAKLDINNVQLNTISGLHFATFGGTWQTVVFGFGGVQIGGDGIRVQPHMPQKWEKLCFTLFYHGARIGFTIGAGYATVTLLEQGDSAVQVWLCGKAHLLCATNPTAKEALQ